MPVQIEIRVYHGIRKYLPAGDVNGFSRGLSLPDGANIAQALSALNIPDDEQVVALLNGVICGPDRVLNSGDVLSIMQAAGGG
jgi:sulfur carrier protein ThiS